MSAVNKKKPQTITEGVIWRQLLKFFFPILLGTFFQQLYNTVDAIVVGKFVGKEALAAVGGATGTLINLIVGFFVGLGSGATVILAQYFGGKDDENVSRTVHTGIAMSLLLGSILSVAGYFFSPQLLNLLNTPEDVMPYAVSYIRIYFLGVVAALIYNIGSGIMHAIGNSTRPLIFLITSCIVNIILDIILVVGLDMGVAGAAWATMLSQCVSAALVLITLCRSRRSYQLHFKKLRLHADLLVKIIKIGLPAGLQSVMYSFSNVLVQSCINDFGTDTMAAWTAYSKLDSVYWMIISAFGISITTFVGQNFGARQYHRMKRSVGVCMGMASATAVLVTITLMVFGNLLYSMFTNDPEVIRLGMVMLNHLAPFYITYVCVEVLSGAVRGTGDSVIPTVIVLFGICVIRSIWILLIVPGYHDLKLMLDIYPITWSLTSLAFVIYYFKGSWLERGKKRSGHTLEA